MKTTAPMDLERAGWLRGVHPESAVRLHPRRAKRPLDPASSKMGWPFLWPVDEPWPICRQKNLEMARRVAEGIERAKRPESIEQLKHLGIDPDRDSLGLPTVSEIATVLYERCLYGHDAAYLPVLQLRRSDVPEMPFPGDSDLFQLLWCSMVHFEGNGGYLIYWRRSEAIKELRREPPPAAVDGYEITPCRLDPERIDDYPSQFELRPLSIASPESEDDWWQTMEDCGPAPGTKLFGFPKWVQNPDYPHCSRCGIKMTLLVTISSTEFGYGGRDDVRWVPKEDRDILRDAPFAVREEFNLPHNWMIGDGGDAYLFFCRNCLGEFDSRVQCS